MYLEFLVRFNVSKKKKKLFTFLHYKEKNFHLKNNLDTKNKLFRVKGIKKKLCKLQGLQQYFSLHAVSIYQCYTT